MVIICEGCSKKIETGPLPDDYDARMSGKVKCPCCGQNHWVLYFECGKCGHQNKIDIRPN